MLPAHCVIRKKALLAKNIPPVFKEILKSIKKCIDAIRNNA